MEDNFTSFPFFGAATALATPFSQGGIDTSALQRMIRYQKEKGIDALVLCGTTGEAAALTEKEYESVLAIGGECIGGDLPFIAGCGSCDTSTAVKRATLCKKHGAAALLAVTPYYNKGTREGIRRHFFEIADACGLPVILYHVPSRTGVHLSLEDIVKITAHPLIRAVKEASGDLALFAALCEDKSLFVYTGNDSLLLPSLALGGSGVISVLSNLLPGEVHRVCALYKEGKKEEAAKEYRRYLPLVSLLFKETNPAPPKTRACPLRAM